MSAFNANTKTPRAVVDPQTDHKLPQSNSLSWKAITTNTALAGTTGAHCELVHGDQWNELTGSHTVNIGRDQTIKVVGKHKETVVESCYQNIIGPHLVQNNNVRNETRLAKYTEIYGQHEVQDDHDGEMVVCLQQFQRNYMAYEMDFSKVEIELAHAEAKGMHAQATACNAECKLADQADALMEQKIKLIKSEFGVLAAYGKMLHTDPTSVWMMNIMLGVNQIL